MISKKFELIADTTIDRPKSWFDDNGVLYVQHGFVVGGEELWDDLGVSVSVQEIMQKARAGEKMSTLQGRLEDFQSLFRKACEGGLDALYVGFSSGLSGTFNTAQIAASMIMEEYPDRKILCVDTLGATMGQGIQVIEALRLRDEGMTVEDAAAQLNAVRLKACHFFTVDDLNHLYRGGRVSKTSALVGTLVGIKPVMYVSDEGKLTPLSKVRGRKASMAEMVKMTQKYIVKPEEQTIYITHGDCEEEANELRAMVEAAVSCKNVVVHQLSPVIAIHSGPGTLAIFFWGDKRL